jgi:TonB family protein
MLKFQALIFTLIFFSAIAVSGQTPKPLPKSISGGIVNSKAINLPPPVYPAAAKAVRASGAVNVQVTIDEKGDVVSAEATSGHPLLRDVSVQAARQAKFSPTKLSGQPVKVTGVIVYNFNLTEGYEDKVKVLAVSTLLSMLRLASSDADLKNFDAHFPLHEMQKEVPAEFPEFARELSLLANFKKMTAEKRRSTVDTAAAAIKTKLTPAETWQYELGANFGEFLAHFVLAIKGEEFEPDKFDETAVKLNLKKIKDLTYSAPPEFPSVLLEKFKQFAAFADQEKLLTPENAESLFAKFEAILETISPEPDK